MMSAPPSPSIDSAPEPPLIVLAPVEPMIETAAARPVALTLVKFVSVVVPDVAWLEARARLRFTAPAR